MRATAEVSGGHDPPDGRPTAAQPPRASPADRNEASRARDAADERVRASPVLCLRQTRETPRMAHAQADRPARTLSIQPVEPRVLLAPRSHTRLHQFGCPAVPVTDHTKVTAP